MRVLAVDVGERRIGLAISDVSRTLARPLLTMTVRNAGDGVDQVAAEIAHLVAEDDGLSTVVVGLPVHLDGSASDQTRRVVAFIDALKMRTPLPIVTVDERLTSHEAESLLAERTRDWRERKARLDAVAAAVMLQDYLEAHRA
jgi:putative Holliday junction resolvase